eukprot:TRINITY_DN4770_c1_g1_i1.p1 TRINITY_DN4770_c1_g1~~TRINITY_DN4770_c1_g1_i1.p1  ORF type:complete len:411 (+),score=100.05 TRINITY_DN4770_c1_g1_i1:66-1235(+)
MAPGFLSAAWGLRCDCCAPPAPSAPLPELPRERNLAGAEAAEAAEAVKTPCRHFLRLGTCLYGDSCRFSHVAVPVPDKSLEDRRAWGGRRRLVRKCGKAGALRRFLIETFGEETLAGGEGVLDVAGGAGELAFQLVNLNGLRTTVVDPRPLRVDRFVGKLRRGAYHGTEPLQRFNSQKAAEDGSSRFPGHLRAFLDDALLEALFAEDDIRFEQTLRESRTRARQACWTERGMEHSADNDGGSGIDAAGLDEVAAAVTAEAAEQAQAAEEAQAEDGRRPALPEAAEVARLLRGVSCVVGLHPDQAAGAALDLALALGCPAAIVPCCVYQVEFPKRRLPNGAPVRSPDDLVEWLLAKDPRLRESRLPFEGRNRVVYFKPDELSGDAERDQT